MNDKLKARARHLISVRMDPNRDKQFWDEILSKCYEIETLKREMGRTIDGQYDVWKIGSLWQLWRGGERISSHRSAAGALICYGRDLLEQRLLREGEAA